MGPTAANRFAQLPPSPEVAVAAKTGTTIAAASASPAIPTPVRQDNAAVEPMGQAKLAFDYTHLGREGADYFARMVTEELAVVVPGMRPLLVP
jgi:lysophospholipase L1-like esterase